MDVPTLLPPLPALPVGGDWALFFDIDGTLAEIMPRPEEVVISPDLVRALTRLFDLLDGAVAIVSGRPIAQIDELLHPLSLPAGGLHGLERRLTGGGAIMREALPEWRDEVARTIGAFTASRPGVWLEDKGLTLALHFRGAPEREDEILALAENLGAQGYPGMSVQHGKLIAEFRPDGADKGNAIDYISSHPPFRGRYPVFLGDDVTDEHGFAAVRRAGGAAIHIGAGTETVADWCLPDVAAARKWIIDLAARLQSNADGRTP